MLYSILKISKCENGYLYCESSDKKITCQLKLQSKATELMILSFWCKCFKDYSVAIMHNGVSKGLLYNPTFYSFTSELPESSHDIVLDIMRNIEEEGE